MSVPMPQRIWTQQDAREILGDVDAMLRDVKGIVARRRAAQEALERLRATWQDELEEPACEGHAAFKAQVRALQDAQAALHQVIEVMFEQGIEVSDPVGGRVDFLARNGPTVSFLCYGLDDGALRYWHELDQTCEARRPIPDAQQR